MDVSVGELDKRHAFTANALCASGSIEDALQLLQEPLFYPLCLTQHNRIQNVLALGLDHDSEYRIIHFFFGKLDRKYPFFEGPNLTMQVHNLLNLPNTPEDVRFRQSAVREIVENPRLFAKLEEILTAQKIYTYEAAQHPPSEVQTVLGNCAITPKKLASFAQQIAELPGSTEPMQRLREWAEQLQTDTVFQELFHEKRKLTDARIIALYSERYDGVRYGILKPGVKPEDVFDFLALELSSHSRTKNIRGKTRTETQQVVGYKSPQDTQLEYLAVALGKQKMDILNRSAAEIFAIPAFLMYTQLSHLYRGAVLYRELKAAGYPMVFPEIIDEPGHLEVQDLYPMRLIFSRDRCEKVTNSFHFTPEQRIIQIEGPNNRGKSEAWRSLHFFQAFTNAGYALPATFARSSTVSASHFVSCKSSDGIFGRFNGGSELVKNLDYMLNGLKYVYDGEMVVLDEFGDATNASTAVEIAKRLMPILLEKGCRILLTSHHDALNKYVNQLGGVSYTPDPEASGSGRYKLVPLTGEVDFKSGEVLDGIKFVDSEIRQGMRFGRKNGAVVPKIELEKEYRDDEVDPNNIPF